MKAITAVACLSALCGCATVAPRTHEALIDGHGVTPPVLVVEAGGRVRFVNRDPLSPHDIRSEDCPELSSGILYPNDAHTAQIRGEPRICHFRDLLASTVAGTLQVRDRVPEPGQASTTPSRASGNLR